MDVALHWDGLCQNVKDLDHRQYGSFVLVLLCDDMSMDQVP